MASPLTPAETDILRAMADGLHVSEVVTTRHTSKRTVQQQLNSAYAKLQARTRCHAVAIAIRNGWVS